MLFTASHPEKYYPELNRAYDRLFERVREMAEIDDALTDFETYWRPRLSMAGELLRDRQHYGKNVRRDAI